ncbi:MAG: DUF4432 family protein [Oscillospiraceae bacterium]|nr:DUF4432 family protein [Oscillospiraceae bacterium]
MNGKISNFQQVASLRRYTMTEGKECGLDVIDCDNGNLRFLLNVSKGLDIMQLYHKGQNVSFVSRNGFSRENRDFLNRFEGGMLYTCGLDSIGDREGYIPHGTYHTIPAQVVTARCDEQGIEVEAIIRDTAIFGQDLAMKRRVTCAVGADCVEVEDCLTNLSFKDRDYCLLYHVNVGYPMLDAGVVVRLDEKSSCGRTDWAQQNIESRFIMEEPVADTEETCYFIKMNHPQASIVNKTIGKEFVLDYSGDTLPCFVEWKSMVSGDYALGLEPCSCLLDNGFTYSTIKAGESIDFKLKLSVREL